MRTKMFPSKRKNNEFRFHPYDAKRKQGNNSECDARLLGLSTRALCSRQLENMDHVAEGDETGQDDGHKTKTRKSMRESEEGSKTASPRKRRHVMHSDENEVQETWKERKVPSPLKEALKKEFASSSLVTKHETGLNSAPCFVRSSISLSQLFASGAGQFRYDGLNNQFLKPFEVGPTQRCHSSSSAAHLATRLQSETNKEQDAELDDPAIAGTLRLPRQWEYTRAGIEHGRKPIKGLEFSVMSYNVLAQKLLEDHGYLYAGSDSKALEWQYRRELLLAEIRSQQLDILCLQEVQENHFKDFFQPRLKELGFVGVYQKRTGDKCDGCATFFQERKFSLKRTIPVQYFKGRLLDRDNIALLVELVPKPNFYGGSVDKICVANTHLLFNPRRGDVKLGQLMVLLAELDKCAQMHPSSLPSNQNSHKNYPPVILCGDFNAEPQSHLYKFIARGYLNYDGLLSRLLSGQSEGKYGRDIHLRKNFFPREYGITDQCQYQNIMKDDNPSGESSSVSKDEERSSSFESTSLSNEEENSSSCESSSLSKDPEDNPSHKDVPSTSFQTTGSGKLWHRFSFVSSYKHTIARLNHESKEVTSQHNAGAGAVDFIFYNVAHKEIKTRRDKIRISNIREDKLMLLKRYGLLSQSEIAKLGGLPNVLCPSDHLPLISTFLLQE